MYGATEATARMAWLPPDLAENHPDSIGVAIPGGHLHLDESVDDRPGVGELVYTGPNVMLGYAEVPADLALPRVTTELRTGDLAREHDGLFAVVGRRNRWGKVFGLRIDLDAVEQGLRADVDRHARVVATGRAVHAFVTSGRGSPPHARSSPTGAAYPRTRCGSPSCRRCRSRAAASPTTPASASSPRRSSGRRARQARPTATPAPSAPTSSACSAAPMRPTPTRSSRSGETRCPTSSSRPGSPTTSRAGCPGWHVRGSGSSSASRRPPTSGRTPTGRPAPRRAPPPAAPRDVPRHDGRAAGARDRAHRRQPRGPRRPRGRRPPAPRARRLQLRALPALRARRRPHPAATRPRRPGPARRTGGAGVGASRSCSAATTSRPSCSSARWSTARSGTTSGSCGSSSRSCGSPRPRWP